MGLVTKTKLTAKEKLPVEKWPHIFDKKNSLGPGISCFWYFFANFFFVFSEVPFNSIFKESETTIQKQFCLNYDFVLDAKLKNLLKQV